MNKLSPKYKVCVVSIVVSLLLAVFKYFLFKYCFAIPLKADALHSFSDMLTSLLVLLSVYLSSVSENKSGTIKKLANAFELIISMAITAFVIYIGIDIFKQVRGPIPEIKNHYPALFGTLITIFVTRYLFKYKDKVAKETNSPSIAADALETRLDQLSSVIVFISIACSKLNLRFDDTAASIILIFVLYNGINQFALNMVHLLTGKEISVKKYLKLLAHHISDNAERLSQYRGKAKRIALISALVMATVYLTSGIYTIRPGQQAVIERFGKYDSSSGASPGLHFEFPYPISKITIINSSEIKTITTNFPKGEHTKYLITLDENLIDANVSIQYKITNIRSYIFKNSAPERLIKNMLEAITTNFVGKEQIDDALIHNKEKLLFQIKKDLQAQTEKFEIGIKILSVQFKNNAPPKEVIEAFNEVSSAREDRRTLIDRAHEYTNAIIPEARGFAQKMIYDAEAHKEKVVKNSEGDVKRLNMVYPEYKKSKKLFMKRELNKVIDEILPITKINILDSKAAKKYKIRFLNDK
jgi:modulator of FtsH protease HflK